MLLGESLSGQRLDIQLGGPTPFSRGGDGLAAIGPVEYLVGEAMHALGVPTTRMLAAVSTGRPVFRETPLPGAVVTRVASSHLRVGTFEFFKTEATRQAGRLHAAKHFPEHKDSDHKTMALLECVAAAQAHLVAKWMLIGFIHGVMNTDNTALSGETIDYGPCAFMDRYHPQTASAHRPSWTLCVRSSVGHRTLEPVTMRPCLFSRMIRSTQKSTVNLE